MKKVYSKPWAEIEVYQLSAAIAASCTQIVTLGPEAWEKTPCDEFEGSFGGGEDWNAWSMLAEDPPKPFYEDGAANCNCYYSSGGDGYFTS